MGIAQEVTRNIVIEFSSSFFLNAARNEARRISFIKEVVPHGCTRAVKHRLCRWNAKLGRTNLNGGPRKPGLEGCRKHRLTSGSSVSVVKILKGGIIAHQNHHHQPITSGAFFVSPLSLFVKA